MTLNDRDSWSGYKLDSPLTLLNTGRIMTLGHDHQLLLGADKLVANAVPEELPVDCCGGHVACRLERAVDDGAEVVIGVGVVVRSGRIRNDREDQASQRLADDVDLVMVKAGPLAAVLPHVADAVGHADQKLSALLGLVYLLEATVEVDNLPVRLCTVAQPGVVVDEHVTDNLANDPGDHVVACVRLVEDINGVCGTTALVLARIESAAHLSPQVLGADVVAHGVGEVNAVDRDVRPAETLNASEEFGEFHFPVVVYDDRHKFGGG